MGYLAILHDSTGDSTPQPPISDVMLHDSVGDSTVTSGDSTPQPPISDGMAKRRRNQKHDDASSKKRINIWSDLSDDILFLVMMQLGMIDYAAFSKVCKSWRSVALCNKKKFIVTRPPMSLSVSDENDEERKCEFADFEGRKLKANLPLSSGRMCIGVISGHLIFCGACTRDLWLVNPFTRHQLYFPFPFHDRSVYIHLLLFGVVLVFSPSISKWVLVVFKRTTNGIWFCIAGKREWTCVDSIFPIFHLQAFKGKIYLISSGNRLGEVRLFPTPKVTLLEIKNLPNPSLSHPRFVVSRENLYAMNFSPKKIYKIDLSKMEWVSCEKAGEEYGLFVSHSTHICSIRAELLADHQSKYTRYVRPDQSGDLSGNLLWSVKKWYFFYECLDVNLLSES